MPFKVHPSGISLNIRLTPNARKSEFGGLITGADGKTSLKVSINAVPEDGKANKELIAFLAKAWKLPKSSISILSGHAQRQKVVFMEGMGKEVISLLLKKC